MGIFDLAKKLYAVGYSHPEVRRILAYAYKEQTLPNSVKTKRKCWELLALEEIGVSPQEIVFNGPLGNIASNYF